MKINDIAITGLRGVRDDIAIPLDGKSILIYGDNGTGKSTLSDVLEWFYYDKVKHLSTEEIGKKGHEALRNIFLNSDQQGFVSLKFSKEEHNSKKSIETKNDKLKVENSNSSEAFIDYLKASSQENLILRYRDLTEFVLNSKSGKLSTLSDIIGYSQVTDVRCNVYQSLRELVS